MATILFAAYVIYFYAPDLIFRFGASSVHGFRTLKNHSQVQEFFSAGLPSTFLHLETFLLFNIATHFLLKKGWFIPSLETIKPLLAKEASFDGISGRGLLAPIFYAAVLYLNAYRVGHGYGETSTEIARSGGINKHFDGLPWYGKAAYLPYRFWYLFYSPYHDPLYPIVLRESVAYVHTEDTIFYGRIFQLDKDREGDNEGIYLTEVSQYNRAEQDKVLERGENPITQMSGPVYIKWSQIRDINYPIDPDDTLERKRLYFAEKLKNTPRQNELPLRYEDPIN